MIIHKDIRSSSQIKISLILLDWSVRESFHSLYWLNRQNIPKDIYELIWIELYERVVSEVIDNVDVYITCNQKGMYHKHKGYNIGLLKSKGQVIVICDSDAVFPPNFIESIIKTFDIYEGKEPKSMVLMHYEWRTSAKYPKNMKDISEIKNFIWQDLWPNVGACMSFRKFDAVRFGGFDEHKSYKGYMCGPYDLGWRLINAGIPELWHDPDVALYHFSHPDPPATYNQNFSWKMYREITYPHFEGHALKSVEAFSTGRLLPLKENSNIFSLRMSMRKIGTDYEKKYAHVTGADGFSIKEWLNLYLVMIFLGPLKPTIKRIGKFLEKRIKPETYIKFERAWRSLQFRWNIRKH